MLATELFSEATLRFVLLGAATGALTALVALAVVIVYRVSGVLNFAAPALGAVGAFVCYSLRDDHGWATAPALVVGLAVGTALGILTWAALVLLQGTSLLSRLIATLALLSAAESAMLVIWPEQVSQPRSLLPDRTIVLFGDVRITQDRLILIGLALVLAVILGLIYRYTLFGLATSAVSESRRVASIARWAPGRIEFVNHLIAGFLAALAAILLAPILTLNGAILSVAVLPALAAALVGRFSSFAITVAAALGIGILQSEVSLFQPDLASGMGVSAASLTGLSQAVPLVIILIVAVLSGRLRPARGESVARLPLPGSGHITRVALVVGVVVGAVLVATAESYADALITTFGMSIIVASVVVVSGYAGQLSLCQYALAGFGAWAAATGGERPRCRLPGRAGDRRRRDDRGGRARRAPGDPDARRHARDRHPRTRARVQLVDLPEREHDGRLRRDRDRQPRDLRVGHQRRSAPAALRRHRAGRPGAGVAHGREPPDRRDRAAR